MIKTFLVRFNLDRCSILNTVSLNQWVTVLKIMATMRCLVYLTNALEHSDWSVWTFYKPHLTATGTEKTAGGGLITMDCLQTTCWESLNSMGRWRQIRSKRVCWKSMRMVCSLVKKQCMQFYLDIWMYTLVSVCTLLIHIVIPLYESHGHTKQF